MASILVVDDMAVFREQIAATLRREGYETHCASNGKEALGLVREHMPDLILLDLRMPVMDGLTCLSHLRNESSTHSVPVIVLTAVAEKEMVEKAARIGVQGYLLKSQFSLDTLLKTIKSQLTPESRAETGRTPTATAQAARTDRAEAPPQEPAHQEKAAAPSVQAVRASAPQQSDNVDGEESPEGDIEPPRRLSREETVQRLEDHTQAKTLAGNVMEVMGIAGSSRGDAVSLVSALKRDPMLSARVLQVANSAAYASNKPSISTVEEAVRNIGFSAIRSIASAAGVFEIFPADAVDGFNALRCWQHSFAVATILDRILPEDKSIAPGAGHLVGLCHDLTEIILRHVFKEEYDAALNYAQKTGKPLHEAEAAVFGLSRHEVIALVLSKLALPREISGPILEYARRSVDRTLDLGRMARALRLADYYSHGLQLAATPDPLVGPITRSECGNALGTKNPSAIDGAGLRNEVLALTTYLARLSSKDASLLSVLPYSGQNARIWYARHDSFAPLDPLSNALESLGTVTVHNRLPNGSDELEGFDGMVIATFKPGMAGFAIEGAGQLTRDLVESAFPVLYLVGSSTEGCPTPPANVQIVKYPMHISRLAQFVEQMGQVPQNA